MAVELRLDSIALPIFDRQREYISCKMQRSLVITLIGFGDKIYWEKGGGCTVVEFIKLYENVGSVIQKGNFAPTFYN